jgi:hypothetical protein
MLFVHLPVEDGHGDVHLLFEFARAEAGRGDVVVVCEDEGEGEVVVYLGIQEEVGSQVDVADGEFATGGEDASGDLGEL